MDLLQILQGDLTLALEDLVDVLAPQTEAHIPLLDCSDPFRVREIHPGQSPYIAERRASKRSQDRLPSRPQPLRFCLQIGQVCVPDRFELLCVIVDIQVVIIYRVLAFQSVEVVARGMTAEAGAVLSPQG